MPLLQTHSSTDESNTPPRTPENFFNISPWIQGGRISQG